MTEFRRGQRVRHIRSQSVGTVQRDYVSSTTRPRARVSVLFDDGTRVSAVGPDNLVPWSELGKTVRDYELEYARSGDIVGDGFDRPHPVDDLTLAFPAHVVGRLIPDMSRIPVAFGGRSTATPTHPLGMSADKWVRLADSWFGTGIVGTVVVRPGIDAQAAVRHFRAVLGSFEPKHEHKIAAVAYLMSRWFERYEEETTTDPGVGRP